MFFQNMFWIQKFVTNQFKQWRNCFVTWKQRIICAMWKCLIKIESTWRCRIKEQATQLTLLFCGRTIKCSHWSCCTRELFLKFFAISTGNTCIGVYCRPSDQQKRPQHRCFPVNIAKSLILPILKNIEIWLLFNFSMVHSYMDLKI